MARIGETRIGGTRSGAAGIACGVLVAACGAAMAQPAGTDPEAPPSGSAASSDASGLPEVRSKEDFLALDRDERRVFSRARRPAASFFVDGRGRWSAGAEIDDVDGEIDVARLGAGAGVSFRLNDTTDFIVRMGTEVSYYDFSDAGGILPGMPTIDEPWDGVHQTTISPLVRSLPETGWQWTLGGRVTSAGESGADFNDTLVAGGFGLLSYDVTPELRLGAGVNVVTRLEGGVFVFPVPIIQWDVTDDFLVGTTERGFGATYFFDANWSAGVQVGFLRREYRLEDDNAISGGSFTDIRVPVTLAVTYSPSPKVVLTGRIGSEVWGDLEINDRNENEVASYGLSPSLLVGFDLRIAF